MLKGLYTAIITPFKEDLTIDWVSFEKLVEEQIEAGVTGITFMGTTGESATLSPQEHIQILKWSKKIINDRCTLIHSTGSNNTQECLTFCKKSAQYGADAQLVICPYYNKPMKKGIIEHYKKIAEVENAPPVIIYNIKSRTGINIDAETILEMGKHPNILAVKEASEDLGQMLHILQKKDNHFSFLSGDDSNLLPLLASGADGVISVLSNVAPKTIKKIIDLCFEGNINEARVLFYKIFSTIHVLFIETNPIPIKTIMALMGKCKPYLRLPLSSISQKGEEELKKHIDTIRYLESQF